MKKILLLLSSPILLASLSCGGGGGGTPGNGGTPTQPATRLVYVDPSGTSSWRLVKNSSSTNTLLVLDLLAPDGASGRGVTCILTPGKAVAWKTVDASSLMKNGIYQNESGSLTSLASKKDASLRVLLCQTNGNVQTYGIQPILTIALGLNASVLPGAVSLEATAGGHLGTSEIPETISIAVGTLNAQ